MRNENVSQIWLRKRYPQIIFPIEAKIFRFYTEPSSSDEEEGWSDWSVEAKPFNKFKYTFKKVFQRAVFIVDKSVSLEEFKALAERSGWFSAVKKKVLTEKTIMARTEEEVIKEIVDKKLLSYREMELLPQIEEFIREAVEMQNNMRFIKGEADVVKDEGEPTLVFVTETDLPFSPRFAEMPFVIELTVQDEAPELTVRREALVSLIKNIAKHTPEEIKIPEQEEITVTPKYAGKLIQSLLEGYNVKMEWRERIYTWYYYNYNFKF